MAEGPPFRSLRETLPFGEPTLDDDGQEDASARRMLLVMGRTHTARVPLPEKGDLVIGRSPECAVVVDETSVSRRHAVLHVDSEVVEIEDLGSANGTTVDGVRLEPEHRARVVPGRPFELGSVAIVQHTRRMTPAPPSLAQSEFLDRVRQAIQQAGGRPGPYLVRFRAGLGAADGVLQRALASDVDAALPLVALGAGEYLLLAEAGASPGEIEAAAERIRLRVEAKGMPCSVGVARYPVDGEDATALEVASGLAALRAGSEKGVFERGALRALLPTIEAIARGTLNVLIVGETGVGKEVVAEGLHTFSSRVARPFVCINCAALSETLLESELFGHERGAFTGAIGRKRGLLESAAGGTVLLDEVGELPITVQAKLLRALEERRVRRVGGESDVELDVRFLAATNRDLEHEVATGTFRSDLFYRLAGATIRVPPLRERKDEIRPLLQLFLERASLAMGRAHPPTITPAALQALLEHPWPGNIRELRNVVERAVLLSQRDEIDADCLQPSTITSTGESAGPPSERERIMSALAQCGGNQSRAAVLLGIPRRTLVRRLKQFDIPRPKADK